MPKPDDYLGLVPVTMSDEQAIAAFVARYHKQPLEVKRTPTCILVGPVPALPWRGIPAASDDWPATYPDDDQEPLEVLRNPTCILVGPKPRTAYTDQAWLADLDGPRGRGGRRLA